LGISRVNIIFTVEDAEFGNEIPFEALADVIHPMAAVYWDRDFPSFGVDLEVSNSGYPLRVVLAKNGTAYAFTGDHVGYIAVWNFVDLRWMPGNEVRKWLEVRAARERKVETYLDHNWERTRSR